MGIEKPFVDPESLRLIRQNTNWQQLFVTLGIQRDEKRSRPEEWWGFSPLTKEKTPSFHMNDQGVWFDFSAGLGGGPIELVQAVLKVRGQTLDCFKAGAWLLENGLSSLSALAPDSPSSSPPPVPAAPAPRSEKESLTGKESFPRKSNSPVRQNLLPLLSLQGEHPMFVERGVSKETCLYLGCGFLEKSRGPLKGRIVFQIRGLTEKPDGSLQRVVLSHIGRATTPTQEERDGKWHFFAGFNKSCEVFNVDNVLLDDEALAQAKTSGHVLLVEGAFDVAKLVEAGIKNVVAAFGAHLSEAQVSRLAWLVKRAGLPKVLVFLDRDDAGRQGSAKALELLHGLGLVADTFDWDRTFSSPRRSVIRIPDTVKDPCDFSTDQLRWLREKRVI